MIVNIQNVADRHLLTTLSATCWRATRKHRGESQAVNSKHGTIERAKVMVEQCKHEALLAIRKLQAELYAGHRARTMPTIQDGMRMIAVAKELDHSAWFNGIAGKINDNVDLLAADYWNEYDRAQQTLNGLFDARAWPKDISALRSEFSADVKYLSMPTDGAWKGWLEESVRAADDELRARLVEALERVAERCGANGGEGRLHETVFTNLESLISMVPDYDFAGKYSRIIQAAKPLATVKADVLRDNKTERSKVAEKAKNLLDVLGGIK